MADQLPVQSADGDREGNGAIHTELPPVVSDCRLGQSPLAIHTVRSCSSMSPHSKGGGHPAELPAVKCGQQ